MPSANSDVEMLACKVKKNALEKTTDIELGLEAVSQGLARAEITGEHFWDAELYRLQGELLLWEGGIQAKNKAETSFLRAIDVAHLQQAKTLELRAAASLNRLRQIPDELNEPDQHLSEIYEQFTEGFDTLDLKKVKAMLTGIE